MIYIPCMISIPKFNEEQWIPQHPKCTSFEALIHLENIQLSYIRLYFTVTYLTKPNVKSVCCQKEYQWSISITTYSNWFFWDRWAFGKLVLLWETNREVHHYISRATLTISWSSCCLKVIEEKVFLHFSPRPHNSL